MITFVKLKHHSLLKCVTLVIVCCNFSVDIECHIPKKLIHLDRCINWWWFTDATGTEYCHYWFGQGNNSKGIPVLGIFDEHINCESFALRENTNPFVMNANIAALKNTATQTLSPCQPQCLKRCMARSGLDFKVSCLGARSVCWQCYNVADTDFGGLWKTFDRLGFMSILAKIFFKHSFRSFAVSLTFLDLNYERTSRVGQSTPELPLGIKLDRCDLFRRRNGNNQAHNTVTQEQSSKY